MSARSTRKTSPWALVALAVLIFVIVGWQTAVNVRNKKTCTMSTTGVVISVSSHHERRSGWRYTATVSYNTESGTYTVRTPSSGTHFTEGQHITVNYSPSDPSKAYTPDYTSHPIMMFLAGLFCLAIGCVGLYKKYILRTGY